MTLILTIENFTSLPDGGPLGISVSGKRGIDIGRDQYLDWTLPDPDRVISGKHAEVRYRDGGYWLQDVSRNGTFLNRNGQRLQEAYRLKDGDRIGIGQYLIAVRIEGEEAPSVAAGGSDMPAPQDYWGGVGDSPPPIPSRDLRPPASLRPVKPDFIDWAVDLPSAHAPDGPPPPRRAPVSEEMDWARATPGPPPPSAPPLPTPRRPAEPWASEPPRIEAAPPWIEAAPARIEAAPPLVETAPAWAEPAPVPGPPLGEPSGFAPSAAPVPPPVPSVPIAADEFMRRFAAGAGIAPEVLAWRESGDLAEEAGALVRLCTEGLKQLLAARTESKRAAKTASHTVIQALDNNPLKFAPTVEDALRIMLGRPSSGYLDARRASEAGFRDLKTHQVKTYSAMQNALRLLMEDLGPEGIEASDEKDRGLSGLLGSRKARLWDIYTTRWDALASPHDDGMIDAFMIFFSDCYDNTR